MAKTLKDIAAELGVAVSTVSKVINGKGSISEEMQEKILLAVKNANYQPNLNARSLRTKETQSIGVILPDVVNLFYCYLLKGIEAKCQQENYSVLLCNCNYNGLREMEYFDLLKAKNVTGMILGSLGNMERFGDYSGRLVTINEQYPDDTKYDYIAIDNRKAMRDLTQHVVNLGHTKIACLYGSQFNATIVLRKTGFIDCMEENGITGYENLMFDGGLDTQSGYEAAKRLMLGNVIPTAIICHNNTVAYGANRAVKEAGYSVPGDISIACFDAINQGGMSESQFTCIMQPVEMIGCEAVDLIIKKSTGGIPPDKFIKKTVPYQLVYGDSVQKL